MRFLIVEIIIESVMHDTDVKVEYIFTMRENIPFYKKVHLHLYKLNLYESVSFNFIVSFMFQNTKLTIDLDVS